LSIDLTAIGAAFPSGAGTFLARLGRLGGHGPVLKAAEPDEPVLATSPITTLTTAMLRSSLLEIGVSASDDNLLLAEAFAKLGLPVTAASLTDAHISLAMASGASPLAYALAKSLSLPTTPDILRALVTVSDGIPARRALPSDVMGWLSLALDSEEDAEAMAAHLSLMVNQRVASTEQRLSRTEPNGEAPADDTRSLLLRLAQTAGDKQIKIGSDTLAAQIEGQQLINLAAQRDGSPERPPPLYFALPLLLPGEQTMMEMSIQRRSDAPEDDWDEDESNWATSIRLATSRLGRIEAQLSGNLSGALVCRLGAERTSTVRLLQRSREKLLPSLYTAGWSICDVSCRLQTEWPPLWHGGEALTAPRARVDWKA
jgi:hypothetical protein